jgi:hypothetical protein
MSCENSALRICEIGQWCAFEHLRLQNSSVRHHIYRPLTLSLPNSCHITLTLLYCNKHKKSHNTIRALQSYTTTPPNPTNPLLPRDHITRPTASSDKIKMSSFSARVLQNIDASLGLRRRNGAVPGRSVLAWSRVGEKDGEEGSEREESDTAYIITGVLTIVAIGVAGRWLWIRNVKG